MTDPLAPAGSLLAEQLVGLNTKVNELAAARVTYVAGTVTALDHVNSTFAADIQQPDATTTNVAGIRSAPQFLPAVGNVVTLGLSGPQIIYIPYGVALASIDTPQLGPTISTTLAGASAAVGTANAALYSGQNLVPDPSFENGFIATFTAPFSLDSTVGAAHTGGNAVKAVASGSAQNLVVTTPQVPILQGHTYRLSGWRKTDAGYNGTSTNGKLKLVKQDGTTAVASAVWTNGTSYAQVQTTYTVPSDGSVSAVQVVVGTDHSAGTLWVDDLELMDITDAAAAQSTASGAASAAATKIITFIQSGTPTASEIGDLWINTTSNQTLYRWNGVSWVQVQDQQIQTALTNAAGAQTTANTKIITFVQATAPTASETGDMWMDSSNGNKLFRWSGAAWVSVQDTAIANALAVATAAQTTANNKVLVFAQATTPTASELGDIWFNTGDGMKMYIWGPTPTVTRINYALNPSFEADTSGTKTSVTGWTLATSGSNGTVTRSIVTTGGVTNASKAFKSSASSQAATLGVWHGVQQSSVAAPGDIYRIQATFQVATTGANFVPQILVEWLNASNNVISSVSGTAGSGSITTNQLLTFTTGAAPALTTSARVTLCRRTAATTGSALATSDVTIDSVLIEKNRDSAAPTTYFDGGTGGTDATWGNPNTAPNAISTTWQVGVSGVNAWQLQQFRTGSLEPQSILGTNCIAYGSITAPLLEALLVLAGTIVAGNPNADHAALMTDGLHLFRTITGEGLQEVGTLAVGSFGTVMSWVDATGKQVAQVDEGGAATFVDLNVDNDPVFQGAQLSDLLTNIPGGGGPGTQKLGARNWVGWDGTALINGFTAEVGLMEMSVLVETGRIYWIVPSMYWQASTTTTFMTVTVRDGGTGTPSLTSPIIEQCFFDATNTAGNFQLAERHRAQRFTTSGEHRLLLTVAMGGGGSGNIISTGAGQAPMLQVIDLGPDYGNPASTNRGGGGTPAPLQQTYTGDISPSGAWSYRNGTTLRTDTTDVVQGTDPSGFNGDGKGGWNFGIPNVSGTVDRVDLYIYNNWSYNNSGGQALISLVSNANTASPATLQGAYNPGVTYPKPGPVTVTLPSSWYTTFKSKTSIGLYLGPSGTANETFYIRADGPSARLRMWYTQ